MDTQTTLQAKVTPKDFFLWAGAMATLYGSAIAFITLFFQYIDYAFPDALVRFYGDPYEGPVRFAIASLVVLFPAFLVLMRLIRKSIERDGTRAEIWVRRWALYLTLFIAGATLVIDLITLVNTFLGGELTARFLLKVLVVFLVVGAAFLHFLSDIRGYWVAYPKKARMVGYGAGLAIALSIISGFFIIGSPMEARLYRFDEQKVSDLQTMQWQVVNYYQQKGKLPQRAEDLEDSIGGFVLPRDPQTNTPYEYRTTKKAPVSFELCAQFNKESRFFHEKRPAPAPFGNEVWEHAEGMVCFERTIDPERYPVFKN